MKKNILLTGGAGFIGSNLLRLMINKYPDYKIINLDKLTYAGNLENLTGLEDKANYTFVKGDICDSNLLNTLFEKHNINAVMLYKKIGFVIDKVKMNVGIYNNKLSNSLRMSLHVKDFK